MREQEAGKEEADEQYWPSNDHKMGSPHQTRDTRMRYTIWKRGNVLLYNSLQ
jgi:hypothetical protein